MCVGSGVGILWFIFFRVISGLCAAGILSDVLN